MTLVSSFLESVEQVSFVMTAPTFETFVTVLTGRIFARRHTVAVVSLGPDAVGSKHHSSFHRLFAKAECCLDELGLAVFRLMLPWVRSDPILLAVDGTLARKRGLEVFGVSMHRDPMSSRRKVARLNRDDSWVVLSVIVRFPFCSDRCFALPILCRRKQHASFADMLTVLRRESIREQLLSTLTSSRGTQKVLATLLHAVQQAA